MSSPALRALSIPDIMYVLAENSTPDIHVALALTHPAFYPLLRCTECQRCPCILLKYSVELQLGRVHYLRMNDQYIHRYRVVKSKWNEHALGLNGTTIHGETIIAVHQAKEGMTMDVSSKEIVAEMDVLGFEQWVCKDYEAMEIAVYISQALEEMGILMNYEASEEDWMEEEVRNED